MFLLGSGTLAHFWHTEYLLFMQIYTPSGTLAHFWHSIRIKNSDSSEFFELMGLARGCNLRLKRKEVIMKRFFEILQRLILIGGIAATLWATMPNISYADGDEGGDGGQQVPRPPNPQP